VNLKFNIFCVSLQYKLTSIYTNESEDAASFLLFDFFFNCLVCVCNVYVFIAKFNSFINKDSFNGSRVVILFFL
jgi:hypothetical protein